MLNCVSVFAFCTPRKAYESRRGKEKRKYTFVINGRQTALIFFQALFTSCSYSYAKNCFFRQLNPLYLYKKKKKRKTLAKSKKNITNVNN